MTDLLINGKNMNNGKPLSRKTAVHHLSLISDVFSYAIRMGMLTDNLADGWLFQNPSKRKSRYIRWTR